MYRISRRFRKMGFTLIEVLLSLFITCLICLNIPTMISSLKRGLEISRNDEDIYIAFKQISQYCLGGEYVSVNPDFSFYSTKNEQITISLHNNRLIKEPGFEILLFDIDNAYFELKDDFIYLKLERDQREFLSLITYAKEYVQENKSE